MDINKKCQLNRYNYFNNCFFSTIMTICDCLGVNQCKLGVGLLFPYAIENSSPIELYIQTSLDNIMDLLCLSGVHYIACQYQKNVIDALIRDIDGGRLVLLCIDEYYDSENATSFLREHSRHYIIVTGYNRKKREFSIIKHDYINENNYQVSTIKSETLEKCYYGADAYFKEKVSSYFWFYTARQEKKNNYSQHLVSKYKYSLHALEQFFNFFIICINENAPDESINFCVQIYEKILQLKKELAFFYLTTLGENNALTKTTKQIASLWNNLYDIARRKKQIVSGLRDTITKILINEYMLSEELKNIFDKGEVI